MSEPLFRDPGEELLQRDPTVLRDPNVLSPDAWAKVAHPEGVYHELGEVALAVGVAFLVIRSLMRDELLWQSPSATRTVTLLAGQALLPSIERATSKYVTAWNGMASPAFSYAMGLGSTNLTPEERQAYATIFSHQVFDYANSSSAQALVRAFDEQLAQKWHPDVAWMRAVNGYGLDNRSMSQYLKLLAEGKDPLPHAARLYVQKALDARARKIGLTESHRAQEMGKTIAWLSMYHRGELPKDVRREWLTAEDERTCVVCAPMDKVSVPMAEQFLLPDGEKVWAPGIHPNCRCQVRLAYPKRHLSIVKRDYTYVETEARDAHGRWADTEERHEAAEETHQATVVPTARGVRAGARVGQAVPTGVRATTPVAATTSGVTATASSAVAATGVRPSSMIEGAVKPYRATQGVRAVIPEKPPKTEPPKGDFPFKQPPTPYYLFANELYEGKNPHVTNMGWTGDMAFTPGQHLNLDKVIPQGGPAQMAIPAAPFIENPRELANKARDFYANRAALDEWERMEKTHYDAVMKQFYDAALEQASEIVRSPRKLSERGLRQIFKDAGEYHAQSILTQQELRDILAKDLVDRGGKFQNAYLHYLENHDPEAVQPNISGNIGQTVQAYHDEMAEQHIPPRTPTVFVFNSYRGQKLDKGNGRTMALIDGGKYRVNDVEIVPLKPIYGTDAPAGVMALRIVKLDVEPD